MKILEMIIINGVVPGLGPETDQGQDLGHMKETDHAEMIDVAVMTAMKGKDMIDEAGMILQTVDRIHVKDLPEKDHQEKCLQLTEIEHLKIK